VSMGYIRPRRRTLLRSNDGTMMNPSQMEQTWICPVVRDHVVENPEYARITVIENGTKCSFEARDPNGLNPQSATSDRQAITQGSPPPQLIVQYSYGIGENDVLSATDHGCYFSYVCHPSP